jgi:hypothetical protein
MWGDTNPPDEDHWLADFEREPAAGWEFFIQPPGLIEVDGSLVTNPAAENLKYLPPGYYETNLGAMRAEENNQRKNVRVACEALARLRASTRSSATAGRWACYPCSRRPTVRSSGAEAEGMIGYMIEQELGNLLPLERPFATLLT